MGNHRKSFNGVKHKMIRNYKKNFRKLKSALEHQKLYGKLPEYVDLTIRRYIYISLQLLIFIYIYIYIYIYILDLRIQLSLLFN